MPKFRAVDLLQQSGVPAEMRRPVLETPLEPSKINLGRGIGES
jgi:hypothetical protein